MSFGNVLWKFLVSIALFASTAVNAADTKLYDLYKSYENKVDVCLSESQGVSELITEQVWLSKVNDQELKEVIIYLSRYALNQCTSKERAYFEQALSQESASSQKIIREWLEFDVRLEPPKWLASEKLRQIEQSGLTPFNPIETYKSIKQSQ